MSQCYSPGLEHNRCQAGHPIHHDTTGRYEADTWVHCLIADVVTCPHDSEQILDVRPGKHRARPQLLSGCTCGGISDTGSHYAGCAWAVA